MEEKYTGITVAAVDFDPFVGPEIMYLAPTTESQAEIWTACLLGGNDANRAYNESMSLQFSGRLNLAAMERAAQALSYRHEALRLAFSKDGKQICVFAQAFVDYQYRDLSTHDDVEQQQLVDDYVKQEVQHVFNLQEGPLLKVSLFRLADHKHHLIITAHHIVCDGWSMGILLQDLGKFYSAYAQNGYPNLPEPFQFSAYADEQRSFLESEEYHRIERFWIDQFAEGVPQLSLPTDLPRPTVRTYKSNRLDFSLDDQLVAAVKKLGTSVGCSFVTTLLAAFEVLLYRLTGQDVIVVGLPTAGQSATGHTQLVGHCVNLLPLKSHLNGELPFVDFLRNRKGQLIEALEHQCLTFGRLLQKLNISRDSSRIPLVPVVFNVEFGMTTGVQFDGLTYQLSSNARMYENFELFLNLCGTEKSMVLEWSYNSYLFKASTINRMMAEFEQVLTDIVHTPTMPIKDIQLVNALRLDDIYRTLNDTARAYPADKTLHQLVADQAASTPEKTAIQFGATSMSYGQLAAQANQFANYLLANGVQPGDKVGLCVDRSPQMVGALLAIMKCGAAYVPLDPGYPAERLNFMLTDSGATTLLTSKHLASIFADETTTLYLEEAVAALPTLSEQEPAVSCAGTDLLYVLYTSGSTGKPKGVQITHGNMINFLLSMQEVPGISSTDRMLAVTTISFDIAGLELFLPLISGATVVLVDAMTAKDGRALLQVIEEEQITFVQATPSTWRLIGDAGWLKKFPIKALSGGEALTKELAFTLLMKCDSVWNVYGPTETTVWSTIKRISGTDEFITIGKPIANMQMYILNEYLKPVEQGTVGELFIGGAGVAKGYLSRPELTAERFIANPFIDQPGAQMYRTGDLAKLLENGEIQCLGRIDDQIKLRGYRIELGEIESSLAALDNVKEAVVVVQAERPGDERLAAFVIPSVNMSAEVFRAYVTEWKRTLRSRLPDYMVPVDFRMLQVMPLSPNGKTDRKALAQLKADVREDRAVYTGPRTSAEKLVADIWKECLNLNQIDIFDNFFEVGGHSSIALQVMARLESETGKRLPLATLFEHSTIEKLALVLQMDGKSVTWDSLVPIKPLGNKMPLYIVHGAGLNVLLFNALAKNMDPNQPIYGLQAKGLDGIEEPLTTIEDIAAYYVSAIIDKNPDGPYALAGYSFGGIVAYEMHKQFTALGKTVKLLAMFDTYAYQTDYYDPFITKVLNRTWFLIRKAAHSFKVFRKDPKQVIRHNTNAVTSRLAKIYWRLKDGEEKQQERFSRYYYKLDAVNNVASLKYRLTPQPVVVDLFRAQKHSYYAEDFEYLGWKPFALNGVKVHDIPGDHTNMFSPPNDVEFARVLQQVLDACA